MPVIVTDAGDGVVTLSMDDGKANAFDLPFFRELSARLDEVADAAAVVLAGRPGFFSAGLHTRLLADLDPEGLVELIVAFGRTMLRVWTEPRPVVAAATGHAVAGGTILAMCADHTVAAEGDYRWGLTETAIGFTMPEWILTIARANVPPDQLDGLVLSGATLTPAQAVRVGFADALAPPDEVVAAAVTRARELARLPAATYAATKRRLRGPQADAVAPRLVEDVREALA